MRSFSSIDRNRFHCSVGFYTRHETTYCNEGATTQKHPSMLERRTCTVRSTGSTVLRTAGPRTS